MEQHGTYLGPQVLDTILSGHKTYLSRCFTVSHVLTGSFSARGMVCLTIEAVSITVAVLSDTVAGWDSGWVFSTPK